jgi:hypothetical protein
MLRNHANGSLSALDAVFPNWQSIELFGPSAAGKTHYAAKVAAASDVILSPHTAKAGLAKLVGNIAGRRARRAYENWRTERNFAALERSAHGNPYFQSVYKLIDGCNFPHDKRRNYLQAIYRASRAAADAARTKRRILIDEGLVRRIMALRVTRRDELDLRGCEQCLDLYPWDRNALLLTATRETRVRRLKERNAASGDAHLLHAFDDEATEFTYDLCRKASWNVQMINGDE